ncbi:MAG TPA: IS91 family transposase [Rectinemataceae bacterium]|nr:IS91 family transposase [Rectinemataceae bacterium]
MADRRPEVADVFREHGAGFLKNSGHSISVEQRRVLRDIARCRTAALGGHRQRCEHCGYEDISYNSCRNRHCPKCQASTRAEWLEKEAANLLDVPYFHVVFTLPAEVGPLALQNRREVYGALFRAASDTLSTIARDPKHLGAEPGFLMVLHTWGQNLLLHPHVHCVVPGGGISPDGSRWISSQAGFFLPVRVLSRLFRGKFIALLDGLYKKGKLSFFGQLDHLRDRPAWEAFLAPLRKAEWVVYSKPPFGGPKQVLKYLARYTHRVAISNRRILSLHAGKVRFRWKDYAHGSKQRTMELSAGEFIRRFLLHVIPQGFVRVRHYGFLANRSRRKMLEQARALLGQPSADAESASVVGSCDRVGLEKAADPFLCPRCKQGQLVIVGDIQPVVMVSAGMEVFDTS